MKPQAEMVEWDKLVTNGELGGATERLTERLVSEYPDVLHRYQMSPEGPHPMVSVREHDVRIMLRSSEQIFKTLEKVRAENLSAARQVERMRGALERCQAALGMMIEPDAIHRTSVLHAFAQAKEAEAIARAALSEEPST